MSLLTEIRRRNVHRVAIAYLAGAWLIIQVVETLFPLFGLSDGVIRAVVVVAAIGFVPAVVLAWMFEWTAAGIVRDDAVAASPGRKGFKSLDRAIVALLVIAVGYFAVDKFVIDPARDAREIERAAREAVEAAAEQDVRRSVAVVPFVNVSADPEQEYFSDGIAEELLDLLSKIPELRVVSRSTAFSFKGQNVSAVEVAEKTNATHVLEGSVRRGGDDVRISVRLVDAASDSQVWSETFDRTLDDIFAIQNEIAASVVSELELRLVDGPPRIEAINPRAFELYLQGRYITHTGVDLTRVEEAQRLLRAAIELEPDFVPAIWELARAHLREYQRDGEIEGYEQNIQTIRDLIARLVEIAPDSSYATGWQAYIAIYWDGEIQQGANYFEKAVAAGTDSNVYIQLLQSSLLLERIGRIDDALRFARYAVQLDPACTPCVYKLSDLLRKTGELEQSATVLEDVLSWTSPTPEVHFELGAAWLIASEPEKALEYFDLAGDFEGASIGRLLARHDLGPAEDFEATFDAIISDPETFPGIVALIYAWIGQNDQAFEWLERMIRNYGANAAGFLDQPGFIKLRRDPRWAQFIERHGLQKEDLSHIEFNPVLPPSLEQALQGGD